MLFLICIFVDGFHPQAARETSLQETTRKGLEEELRLAKKELGDAAAKHLVEMDTMKQEEVERVAFSRQLNSLSRAKDIVLKV